MFDQPDTTCDEMTGLVGDGRAEYLAYLDFIKAFNTVSSGIFTEKLMKCGLSEQ